MKQYWQVKLAKATLEELTNINNNGPPEICTIQKSEGAIKKTSVP